MLKLEAFEKTMVGSDRSEEENYLRLILRSHTWEYLSCWSDFNCWPNYPVSLLTCERTLKTPERRRRPLTETVAEVDAPARCWTTSDLIPLFPSLGTRYKMSNGISCTASRYLSCIPPPTLGLLLTAGGIECSLYKAKTFTAPQESQTLDPKRICCLEIPINGISPLLRILHNS